MTRAYPILLAVLFSLAALAGKDARAQPVSLSNGSADSTHAWMLMQMEMAAQGTPNLQRSSDGVSWATVYPINCELQSCFWNYIYDQPLPSATTYYYRIWISYYDEWGYENFYSNVITITTSPVAPTAPTNLTLSASGTQINLSWTNTTNQVPSFKIERKTGANGTYSQIATVGTWVTSYSNTGLAGDTTYYYRVRASNSAGDSGYSNEASASTVPLAPTGLSATRTSGSQVNLAWTDTSATEGGFKIERKLGVNGTYAQITTAGANATSFSDTGLNPTATYYYRIRSTNGGGDSAYTADAQATALAQGQLFFISTDHLNTPRLITDANQQVRWRWDQQEPFGVNAPDENPAGQGAFEFPQRFPGQYADRETNLSYNYFRDYDPVQGRYLRSDPIGLSGGLNTYRYVRNNPLRQSDRLGLIGEWADPSGPPAVPMDQPEGMYACGKRIAAESFRNSLGYGWNSERRDNTPWNAYLHCLWSCEMVKKCGYPTSLGAGTMHELWDDGEIPVLKYPRASRNDFHNNGEGRDCATNPDCRNLSGSQQTCHVCCSRKIGENRLLSDN